MTNEIVVPLTLYLNIICSLGIFQGGASSINDFASEGSLDDAYKTIPQNDRLRIATEGE